MPNYILKANCADGSDLDVAVLTESEMDDQGAYGLELMARKACDQAGREFKDIVTGILK